MNTRPLVAAKRGKRKLRPRLLAPAEQNSASFPSIFLAGMLCPEPTLVNGAVVLCTGQSEREKGVCVGVFCLPRMSFHRQLRT
jgi:hypothetical protein